MQYWSFHPIVLTHRHIITYFLLKENLVRTPLCQQRTNAECHAPVAANEGEQLLSHEHIHSCSELGEDHQQGGDYNGK
jgi:hypothetical protein